MLAKAVDPTYTQQDLRRVGIGLSSFQTSLAYVQDDGDLIGWIRNGQ